MPVLRQTGQAPDVLLTGDGYIYKIIDLPARSSWKFLSVPLFSSHTCRFEFYLLFAMYLLQLLKSCK